jgi:hypothetical protein
VRMRAQDRAELCHVNAFDILELARLANSKLASSSSQLDASLELASRTNSKRRGSYDASTRLGHSNECSLYVQ